MDFYCSKQAKQTCLTSLALIIFLILLNVLVMVNIERDIQTEEDEIEITLCKKVLNLTD